MWFFTQTKDLKVHLRDIIMEQGRRTEKVLEISKGLADKIINAKMKRANVPPEEIGIHGTISWGYEGSESDRDGLVAHIQREVPRNLRMMFANMAYRAGHQAQRTLVIGQEGDFSIEVLDTLKARSPFFDPYENRDLSIRLYQELRDYLEDNSFERKWGRLTLDVNCARFSWMLIVLVLVALVIFFKTTGVRFGKTWTIFIGFIILFFMITFGYLMTQVEVNDFDSLTSAFKIYFTWLGGIFDRVGGITGDVVKTDWTANLTDSAK